jgi:carboxymethylenebutenolidase
MASGADCTIRAAKGDFGGYLSGPSGAPTGGVVVIQEIFGVNHHIRAVCDRLADAGFLALAPDLFHRGEAGVQLGYDEPGFKRGFELMQQLAPADALADIEASLKTLRAERRLRGGKVGVLGFCMGGLYAYRSAANLDPACAVAYYGGAIAAHLDEAARIRCPIQFHFGEKDHFIPLDQIEQIRAATAGLAERELYVYPADHGFNCDERGSFDAAAAKQAWERSMSFLRRHLS